MGVFLVLSFVETAAVRSIRPSAMKRTLWAPAGPHLMDRDIAMSPRATDDTRRFGGDFSGFAVAPRNAQATGSTMRVR
ncbi:hypothetical protein [Burkholderia sp. 22313]|uniref:hypothetical protein n=1 Tax=Burkholderia sp. 22313 TaxID=3453908 RepID=UPI003F83C85B